MSATHTIDAPPAETAEPSVHGGIPRLALRGMSLTLDRRVVLDDVTLSVAPGEVLGILGPNGSGKTSLMRCILGLHTPSKGTLWLDGAPVRARSSAFKSQLGVVFQEPSLDRTLTGRENLVLGAALFGVRGRLGRERAADLLAFMELSDRSDEPVAKLSSGMRRRLEIARALIHKPSILLLDEPTTGLDPAAFERTWERLLSLRSSDLAILVSSHHADEAARCDRLAVLDRGHLVACDTPDALLDRVAGDVLELKAREPAQVAEVLREQFELDPRIEADGVTIEVERGHELIPRLVEAFPAGRFESVSMRRPSLADVFFHLTGHDLRDPPGPDT